MQISLNELVSILSSRVGQPFNTALQEEMKVVLNYKRADYFKKLINQNLFQRRFFLKSFSAQLERIDKADCPIEVDCDVLKTIKQVPPPVRTNDRLFDYVGDPDKTDSYAYASPEENALYSKYNRYTALKTRYFYANRYIYIFNDLDLEWINVRGIFDDPKQLEPFQCDGSPCYSDDDQYELPDDIINAMMADTLRVELRMQFPETGEVKIDQNEKTN